MITYLPTRAILRSVYLLVEGVLCTSSGYILIVLELGMETIRKTPKIQKNSKKCSISTCGKSYRSNAGIQLFKFPDPSTILGQIWRLKCGFPLDSKKPIICQHHFMPGCYGKRYLKKNSIPTLNLAPIEDCPKKNSMVETLVYQMEHQDDNSNAMMIPTPEMSYVKLENFELSSENFQTEHEVEDWAQCNDNNDSFQSSENGKEPTAKRTRLDRTEPDTTGKESDDNMFRLLSASDDVLKDLRTSKNPNKDNIQHQKADSKVLQEALNCMKALLGAGQERDEYTVFVEHIGNKLRTCNRDSIEIKIAQHHIENIVFNLSMGMYSQTGNYNEATNGSPNFRDFQPEIVTPDLPTYQTPVENIIPKEEPDA